MGDPEGSTIYNYMDHFYNEIIYPRFMKSKADIFRSFLSGHVVDKT